MPPRKPPRAPITDTQRKVLEFVRTRKIATTFAPTVKEIAEHFGWSSHNAVAQVLGVLHRRGYIYRVAGTARGIVLIDEKGNRT